jgi:hypothetical protein
MHQRFVFIIALVALIVGIVIGAFVNRPVHLEEGRGGNGVGPYISRYWDSETNVLCWASTWGGMSCLPADQTEY